MVKKQENEKEITKERKLLSPKVDIVFQALFGEIGSERITKKFLEAILERKIEEVDLSENIVLRRENPSDKMGVLDILAKIDGEEYCNIEMQLVEKEKLLERILYYWARIYVKNLKSGDDYNNLKKTIEVLIVNFEIKELKELEYHSKWKIIEESKRKIVLTEDLEIHIIEMPKIYKLREGKEQRELEKWIYFIENPESEKVGEYMKKNEEMKQAKEKLEVISEDKVMQRLAELREKAIRDEKAVENLGIKKGIEQGIKQGLEQGVKQGTEKEKREIAKKMKKMGIDIKIIEEATSLNEEEIRKL